MSRNKKRGNTKRDVVKAPVAKSYRIRESAPSMVSRPDGSIRIRHREFITDLAAGANPGATTFSVGRFVANPALEGTFPWLSGVAINYESYRFKQLKFHAFPLKPTSYGGFLAAAFDYDALDPPPASKNQLLAFDGAQRCAIWDTLCVTCPESALNKLGPQRYVAAASVSGSDAKTYDVGAFLIAWGNSQATVDNERIAEVWVEYDVELYTPQYRPNTISALSTFRALTTTCTKADPTTGMAHSGKLNAAIRNLAANIIRISLQHAGKYLIDLYAQGTGVGDWTPTGKNMAVSVLGGLSNGSTRRLKQFAIEIFDNAAMNQSGSSFLSSFPSIENNYIDFDFSSWTTVDAVDVILTPFASSIASFDSTPLFADTAKDFVLYCDTGPRSRA